MTEQYKRLNEALVNERKRDDIQNIPDQFIEEMKNYAQQLDESEADPDTLHGRVVHQERKFTHEMLSQLQNLRVRKIIDHELGGKPIDAKVLTPEEQTLHSRMRQILAEYIDQPTAVRSPMKVSTVDPSAYSQDKPRQPEQPKDETVLTIVRFLQPLPAIMGIDMKAYGPFKAEDVASIPQQNAENLVKRGIVKRVQVEP
jgi:DNA replication factor GINS